MIKDPDLTLSWIRVGGVCGILSILSYLAAAFLPLPDTLGYAAAFAFGPLVAVGSIGLYHCLALDRRTPLVQIAAVFGIAGGIAVLLMLTTQQAIFALTDRAIERAGASSTDAEIFRKIGDGLNAVHLGIDVAWDVLISTAVILFAISMMRHPRFGKIMGSVGVLLGGLLLVFNIWYFPTPPVSANSIDWGPFVALWMFVVFIMLLRAGKWAKESLGDGV